MGMKMRKLVTLFVCFQVGHHQTRRTSSALGEALHPISLSSLQLGFGRLSLIPKRKKCESCAIAPGAANLCAEHPLVHPNFNTKKAKYSYAVASNVIGDSSPPCGYAKIEVEDGSEEPLTRGEKNRDIDAYWFGTRYFAGEPLIVPKRNSDPNDETSAYLLGMVQDSAKDRSGVAIFDLEKPLKSGPVSMMWLKSSVPHGLHGCFAESGNGSKSVFC